MQAGVNSDVDNRAGNGPRDDDSEADSRDTVHGRRANPPVRCLIEKTTAKKQMENGIDSVASATYLKSRRYVESRVYSGLLWFDYIPGCENFADVGSKQVRDTEKICVRMGSFQGEL